MVKVTIKDTLRIWNKVMYILITVTSTHLCSLTSTTWRLYLKELDQSKFHPTMNLYQEAEEVFFSYSSTLELSILSQDLEDGHTMNGSEVWSGIMNIWLLSMLDLWKLSTSHGWSDLNSQSSITFTVDTRLNNSALCGLMLLKKNKCSIWDTLRSKWSTWEFKMNTTLLRREPSLTSLQMKS